LPVSATIALWWKSSFHNPSRPCPAAGHLTHAPADRGDDVLGRAVVDLLRGVEAQAVEVKFVDPVGRVADEELAHRRGVGTVEVDRVAPFVVVAIGEVGRRERSQVIADRSEVVVDDVENHRDAAAVRGVDEAAEVVRAAVEMRRRE
jgi:hypothetical protein